MLSASLVCAGATESDGGGVGRSVDGGGVGVPVGVGVDVGAGVVVGAGVGVSVGVGVAVTAGPGEGVGGGVVSDGVGDAVPVPLEQSLTQASTGTAATPAAEAVSSMTQRAAVRRMPSRAREAPAEDFSVMLVRIIHPTVSGRDRLEFESCTGARGRQRD